MTCNKIAFDSVKDVKTFLKDIKKGKSKTLKGNLTHYTCPDCGRLHLTSLSKSERRLKSKRVKRGAK